MGDKKETAFYETTLPSGAHWSLRLRQGALLRLTDTDGHANVGMLFYNPENLLERYNAPDTLKAQHTFKLHRGHCLYSDMGRIFASIVEDDHGWHDTVTGNCNAELVSGRWQSRDYQNQRNEWCQNGHDAFLVELGKYGLGLADMAANINWFSKVSVDEEGALSLSTDVHPGRKLALRFEMDTLVLLHACPHPLNKSEHYPTCSVAIAIDKAPPVQTDDECMNYCAENQRGFENNRLYNFLK